METHTQTKRRVTNTQERRRAQRKLVNLKVNHRDPKTKKVAFDFAKDLSETGLFIWTKRHRAVGDLVEVEFEAGDARRHGIVRVTCRVARTTSEGIAAQFVNLDDDSAALLNYFLSR